MYIYTVKPKDTIQSISSKFGGGWEEFLATNIHVEFGGLKVGQTVYIPKHWIDRSKGIGVSGDAVLGVHIVGPNEVCDFDNTSDINTVTSGSNVCGMYLRCVNGICEDAGAPVPKQETVLCTSDSDCPSGNICDSGVCAVGTNPPPVIPAACNSNSDCQSGYYCDAGICFAKDASSNYSPGSDCNDDSVIKFAQSSVGVNPDGKWGCGSQVALDKTGTSYQDLTGCNGNPPDPCVYGQCINGQCPVSGGSKKEDGLKNISEQNDQKETEKGTSWGLIIGGVLLAVAGGAGIYYYSKHRKSSSFVGEHKQSAEPDRRGINNADREQWIDNDEGLYSWWKSSRLSKREFIKQNKAEIDAAIENVIGGTKQAHYLRYDPIRKYGHLNEPVRKVKEQDDVFAIGRKYSAKWLSMSGIHLEMIYPDVRSKELARDEFISKGYEVLDGSGDEYVELNKLIHRVFWK